MIKVIVAITTYNLEKYISQALDSVLSQKTSFKYKILVADDCSTDQTPSILRDYQERYPNVVEVLYSKKNLGSLGNSNRLFDKIECEYFSFLDGDDYWVSDDRLQKQVDFLDNHPEYSMCAGNTQFLRNGKPGELMIEKKDLNTSYTFGDFVNEKMPFIHTSSILLRNTIFINGLPDCYKDTIGTFEECALRGENFRRLIHLDQAPIYVMDELFSVYRIHSAGIWQGTSSVRRTIESAIANNFYSKFFGEKYGDSFSKLAKKSYENMMIWLLASKYLFHPHTLEKNESFLLSGLINDVAASQKNGGVVQPSKIKIYLFKFLTEILHVL